MENKNNITKGTVLYYAQCLETVGVFEVLDLKVRTVEDTWFVGIENRTKHAYLFSYNNIGKYVFFNRKDALAIVKERQKNYKKSSDEEIYYEEY